MFFWIYVVFGILEDNKDMSSLLYITTVYNYISFRNAEFQLKTLIIERSDIIH